MSVEELVRVCSTLPPDGSAVAAVSAAMAYLDSRATAALMKELAKTQQLARAMEIFDWLKSLPAEHELYSLCDVYTFTTAISLMGPSQQLRRALELIGEMRARGLQCNVHTYSALMNVCIKVRGAARVGCGMHALATAADCPALLKPRSPPSHVCCHHRLHSVMRVTWRWMCSSRCMRTGSGQTW